MTIEERVAAMRAGRAAQPQAAQVEKKIHVAQKKAEVAIEQVAEPTKVFDMETNTVAQIMGRSDLSDKGKLEAMVDFLNAKDENESATQKNLAVFEAYFTEEQSKRTQVSEQNIQRLMNELAANTSATVKHTEARAQQFATLIDSQHEVLSNLQQQALPVTASALEMGLQQAVALRDGLLAAGVRDATKKAQEIFGSSLEGATDAQTRLGTENLNQMREAIAALGKAQTIISHRTDKAIEHGLASLELVDQVSASAGAVRDAMSDFERVDAVLASRNGTVAPVIPDPGLPDAPPPAAPQEEPRGSVPPHAA